MAAHLNHEMTDELQQRIVQRIVKPDDCGECWIWNGGTSGRFRDHPQIAIWKGSQRTKQTGYVRRILWSHVNKKPIPTNHIIVTTCNTRLCVNPMHLKLTTYRGRREQ